MDSPFMWLTKTPLTIHPMHLYELFILEEIEKLVVMAPRDGTKEREWAWVPLDQNDVSQAVTPSGPGVKATAYRIVQHSIMPTMEDGNHALRGAHDLASDDRTPDGDGCVYVPSRVMSVETIEFMGFSRATACSIWTAYGEADGENDTEVLKAVKKAGDEGTIACLKGLAFFVAKHAGGGDLTFDEVQQYNADPHCSEVSVEDFVAVGVRSPAAFQMFDWALSRLVHRNEAGLKYIPFVIYNFVMNRAETLRNICRASEREGKPYERKFCELNLTPNGHPLEGETADFFRRALEHVAPGAELELAARYRDRGPPIGPQRGPNTVIVPILERVTAPAPTPSGSGAGLEEEEPEPSETDDESTDSEAEPIPGPSNSTSTPAVPTLKPAFTATTDGIWDRVGSWKDGTWISGGKE